MSGLEVAGHARSGQATTRGNLRTWAAHRRAGRFDRLQRQLGHESSASTIAPSPAAPSAAGSDAYLDNVRDESLGVKGLPNATDAQLLELGTSACHDLSATGGTSTATLQSLMGSSLHPDSADANAVLQAAVGNLCPAQADKAPAPSAVDSGH